MNEKTPHPLTRQIFHMLFGERITFENTLGLPKPNFWVMKDQFPCHYTSKYMLYTF